MAKVKKKKPAPRGRKKPALFVPPEPVPVAFLHPVDSLVDPRPDYEPTSIAGPFAPAWKKTADKDESASAALDRYYKQLTAPVQPTRWQRLKNIYREAYILLTDLMNGITT